MSQNGPPGPRGGPGGIFRLFLGYFWAILVLKNFPLFPPLGPYFWALLALLRAAVLWGVRPAQGRLTDYFLLDVRQASDM